MDSRLSDEHLFLLYLAKYDRPRHLRDRQNPFEKFDDGQFIEHFRLTKATTLALLAKIEHYLEYQSDRNQPLPPIYQLLNALRYATRSFHLVVPYSLVHASSCSRHDKLSVRFPSNSAPNCSTDPRINSFSPLEKFCPRTTLCFPSDMFVYDDDHAH